LRHDEDFHEGCGYGHITRHFSHEGKSSRPPLLGRLIAVLIGLQLQVTLVEIDHPLLGGPAGSLLGGRDLPVQVGVVHFDRLLLFGVFNLLFDCRLRRKRFPTAGTNAANVGESKSLPSIPGITIATVTITAKG
jgi:hypothetical protein